MGSGHAHVSAPTSENRNWVPTLRQIVCYLVSAGSLRRALSLRGNRTGPTERRLTILLKAECRSLRFLSIFGIATQTVSYNLFCFLITGRVSHRSRSRH
jgi:hypothetical protein